MPTKTSALPDGYTLVWATKATEVHRGGKYPVIDTCWDTPVGRLYTSMAVRENNTVDSVMVDMIHDLVRYVEQRLGAS